MILDILPVFLKLGVHCFGFIGHISGDKRKGHMDIVEESFEHCLWVMSDSHHSDSR